MDEQPPKLKIKILGQEFSSLEEVPAELRPLVLAALEKAKARGGPEAARQESVDVLPGSGLAKLLSSLLGPVLVETEGEAGPLEPPAGRAQAPVPYGEAPPPPIEPKSQAPLALFLALSAAGALLWLLLR